MRPSGAIASPSLSDFQRGSGRPFLPTTGCSGPAATAATAPAAVRVTVASR